MLLRFEDASGTEKEFALPVDHGSIIAGAMPDVFRFFSTHTKPLRVE